MNANEKLVMVPLAEAVEGTGCLPYCYGEAVVLCLSCVVVRQRSARLERIQEDDHPDLRINHVVLLQLRSMVGGGVERNESERYTTTSRYTTIAAAVLYTV